MRSLDGLRVAITIGIGAEDESLWLNGIKQNALFLARTIRALPWKVNVVIANTTAVAITEKLPWSLAEYPTAALDDVRDEIDLLIILGGAVPQGTVDRLKARGAKIVAYKCGSEYVLSMEAVLFPNAEIPGDPTFVWGLDEIWLIPQIANLQRGFYETLHRAESRVVPFLWDPVLLEAACVGLPNRGRYLPGRSPKRLTCQEPNRDVVKFCLIPMLIAEGAFRRRPDLIEFLSVTNALQLRDRREFVGVANHLELVRQRRCFFEGRFEHASFLAHHTDVVISHQWENPLNYAYLEAAWLGYPLVHNASLCADLGYFYPGFDVAAGADTLTRVLMHHDEQSDVYVACQRERIQRYLATAHPVVAEYGRLIQEVMSR